MDNDGFSEEENMLNLNEFNRIFTSSGVKTIAKFFCLVYE